jgi:hypothetical protein
MSTNTKKEDRVSLITPEARLSYPALFKARKVNQNDPNEKEKFSAQLLFRVAETPKSKELGEKVIAQDPQWLKMKQAVVDLFIKNLGADWQEKLKLRKGDGSPMYRSPFRDGNAPEKKDVEGYGPGVIFITASSLYKPGVIRQNKEEIMNPQDIQGGYYVRAEIHPYWYSTKGNQGVTFGLDNVQLVREGQPFSGRKKAEDVFDAIDQPAGAPVGAAAGASTASDPLMG